jgi:hypothetical protein
MISLLTFSMLLILGAAPLKLLSFIFPVAYDLHQAMKVLVFLLPMQILHGGVSMFSMTQLHTWKLYFSLEVDLIAIMLGWSSSFRMLRDTLFYWINCDGFELFKLLTISLLK